LTIEGFRKVLSKSIFENKVERSSGNRKKGQEIKLRRSSEKNERTDFFLRKWTLEKYENGRISL
jgi:hypothetical protein